ncbi:hypothetical protein [Methylibium rhizosphaerae]|uniref:hypothetical protein n=1 Tax=Methylibium rhizosphaerae TaxID=2570323 RepID=UPI001129DC7D|nr:hypothetical protein [Methylibium rhizosphaerae]
MATSAKPDATSQTKPNNPAGATQVPVTPKRKVTYVFNAASSKTLSIPYAIAVNGKAQPAFDAKPKRVRGLGGKVVAFVDQGERVGLFLNSDAHPSYRKELVYEVTAGERDIVVTITEKAGKLKDADTPVRKKDKDEKAEAAKPADEYTAPLTGDIWMRVSHKYTAAEASALMPQDTSAEVKAAVESIYNGLKTATLVLSIPARPEKAAMTLTVKFEDANNPKDNITSYALLTDGLTRVHPAGYVALFNAAIENEITSLNVTSCWRPMLGSIAHRSGLGLDVNYVGKTRMNRQELRTALEGKKPSGKGNGNDADNVTDAEVTAFKEYEDAIVARKKADAEFAAATKAAKQPKLSPAEKALAIERSKATREAAIAAAETESQREDKWNSTRDASEPATARVFRTSLLKCVCVQQLFDPWLMDDNTHDKVAPKANMQRGIKESNERLHAHHLHITVSEPGIL